MAICFDETTSGPWAGMRRASGAARLEPGDRVVGAAVAENGKDLLTVTQNGLRQADGALPAYLRDGEAQNRGRQGPENYHLTDKTGLVAGVLVVDDSDDVLVIESSGVIIRMAALGDQHLRPRYPGASF